MHKFLANKQVSVSIWWTLVLGLVLLFAAPAFADPSSSSATSGTGSFTAMPTVAAATSANINNVGFTVPTTDISLGLLQGILGDWTQGTSASSTTMGTLFQSFNLGVLVFGAMLFMYVSIVGTLHTAEDGELLGKRWGSMFVPIRMAGGFAMLFPLANGFSTVQIVVLWMATNGIGLADWVSNQTITSISATQGMAQSIATQTMSGSKLVGALTGIVRSEVCVAEKNRAEMSPTDWDAYVQAGGTSTSAPYGGPYTEQGTSTNSYSKLSWGTNPASQQLIGKDGSSESCGSIEIPNFNSVANNSVSSSSLSGTNPLANVSSWFQAGASEVAFGTDINQASGSVRIAHANALKAAALSLKQSIALPFVNGTYTEASASTAAQPAASGTQPAAATSAGQTMVGQIAAATTTYQASLASQMTANQLVPSVMQNETDPMVNTVRTNGWVALGTMFYQMARIQSELNKMTTYVPTINEPTDPAWGGPTKASLGNEASAGSSSSVATIMSSFDGALRQSAGNPLSVTQLADMQGHFTAGVAQGGVMGSLVTGTNRAANTSSQFLGEFLGVDPNNPKHPLLQLKDVGDNILSVAESIVLVKEISELWPKSASVVANAANLVVSTVGMTGFVTKLFTVINTVTASNTGSMLYYLMMIAGMGMLGFAVMLAYWLPMTPFILWLGGVMGWAISVLEMVCAAPLFAAAHLHPEGEGMSSSYGKNGYMIIIEVFAKPVLMVVGFFIAYKFSSAFLIFASGLFFNSMATVNADSVTGIVTIMCFVFMYVSFCVTLVNRTFSLIHVVPGSVLRWIGASTHDSFTQAEQLSTGLDQDTRHASGAATGAFKGAIGAEIVKDEAGKLSRVKKGGKKGEKGDTSNE